MGYVSRDMCKNAYTRTRHDFTYFEVQGMVRNKTKWIYQEQNMIFYEKNF